MAKPGAETGRPGRARTGSAARGLLAGLALLGPCGGCFSERFFFMQPRDFVPLAEVVETAAPSDTRAWLRAVHGRLSATLPRGERQAMLTEDMVDSRGRAADVWGHFGVRPADLHKLFGNFQGLLHTAQSSGADPAIERPADPWPGFQDVWIPIREGLALSGRLGLAQHEGKVIESDCIVIIPGLLGDLAVKRSRTIAEALLAYGLHALALELRGYGQTEARYPEAYYNFGVIETGDLLAVSEWLEDRPEVRRTGLMGFCWGANHVLLAAWEDGRSDAHPSVSPELRRRLRPRSGRHHYSAGIMAFSPCLRFEEIIEQCEREWSLFDNPVLCTLQEGVRFRKRWKGHPDRTGSIRTLIHYEFARSELHYPNVVTEGLDYLRLMPFRGRPAGDKLESARMPVLIVHGANDPLAPAQDVADFFVGLKNRCVAGVILPGGGHVGFAAWCRPYFYNLILSFFDPVYGAAAVQEGAGRPVVRR